ncbi:hypothetical protein [Brevibacillus daliensis]|nr:hypothetical protein [Brevibacillus daliensis]
MKYPNDAVKVLELLVDIVNRKPDNPDSIREIKVVIDEIYE